MHLKIDLLFSVTVDSTKCTNTSECYTAVPGTECSEEQVCTCVTGKIITDDGLHCVSQKLTDTCNTSMDCSSIQNSMCATNTCVCNTGYKNQDIQECSQRNVGDSCKDSIDCSLIINSECVNDVSGNLICQCTERAVQSTNMTCQINSLGHSCSRSTSCLKSVANSDCENSTCVCQTGYKASGLMSCVRGKYWPNWLAYQI